VEAIVKVSRAVTHIEDFISYYRKLVNHFDGVLKGDLNVSERKKNENIICE